MSQVNDSARSSPAQPKWLTITGWVLTVLIVGGLGFGAVMKFWQPPEMLAGLSKIELKQKFLVPIGILEVICTLIYLFPRTAVLGAVLITGYLGGAILTHLRVDDNYAAPIIMGVIMWLGIYLREPRLRAIMPIR